MLPRDTKVVNTEVWHPRGSDVNDNLAETVLDDYSVCLLEINVSQQNNFLVPPCHLSPLFVLLVGIDIKYLLQCTFSFLDLFSV